MFVRKKVLGKIVEDAVKRMTYITFEASRLVNVFVLYLLENDIEIPPLGYNRFMSKLFRVVLRTGPADPAPKSTGNDDLDYVRNTTYSACRPSIPWNDGR